MIVKNILNNLRRFATSTLLNVVGLSVAARGEIAVCGIFFGALAAVSAGLSVVFLVFHKSHPSEGIIL